MLLYTVDICFHVQEKHFSAQTLEKDHKDKRNHYEVQTVSQYKNLEYLFLMNVGGLCRLPKKKKKSDSKTKTSLLCPNRAHLNMKTLLPYLTTSGA